MYLSLPEVPDSQQKKHDLLPELPGSQQDFEEKEGRGWGTCCLNYQILNKISCISVTYSVNVIVIVVVVGGSGGNSGGGGVVSFWVTNTMQLLQILMK